MFSDEKGQSRQRDLTGQFVRIAWSEALDTVAQKIQEVKAKYGQYSIYFRMIDSYPLTALGEWVGSDATAWGDDSVEGADFADRFMTNMSWGYIGGIA